MFCCAFSTSRISNAMLYWALSKLLADRFGMNRSICVGGRGDKDGVGEVGVSCSRSLAGPARWVAHQILFTRISFEAGHLVARAPTRTTSRWSLHLMTYLWCASGSKLGGYPHGRGDRGRGHFSENKTLFVLQLPRVLLPTTDEENYFLNENGDQTWASGRALSPRRSGTSSVHGRSSVAWDQTN